MNERSVRNPMTAAAVLGVALYDILMAQRDGGAGANIAEAKWRAAATERYAREHAHG